MLGRSSRLKRLDVRSRTGVTTENYSGRKFRPNVKIKRLTYHGIRLFDSVFKKTGGQKFQMIRNIDEVAVFDEVNELTAINIDNQDHD
jgi:hypothetical protein